MFFSSFWILCVLRLWSCQSNETPSNRDLEGPSWADQYRVFCIRGWNRNRIRAVGKRYGGDDRLSEIRSNQIFHRFGSRSVVVDADVIEEPSYNPASNSSAISRLAWHRAAASPSHNLKTKECPSTVNAAIRNDHRGVPGAASHRSRALSSICRP